MNKRPKYIHEAMGGQCKPGDIAPYVLVPGSEARVKKFAEYWDKPRQVAHHYEFLVYSGSLSGIPISACSTGFPDSASSFTIFSFSSIFP